MPATWKESIIYHSPKDFANLSCRGKDKTNLLQLRRIIVKEKCNKSLLKKLKRYKLRKNDIEDPDVIDISEHFRSILSIRSPSPETVLDSGVETEEINIKNYLFKMEKKNKNDILKNVTHNNSCDVQHKLAASNNIQINQESIDDESPLNSKQVNAFQLLMNSCNKSIGSNSLGKIKSGDESDSEEINSKRTLKVKRNAVLQKMAEAKGYFNHLESEELKDQYIKRKMAKRKERLKKILTSKKESTSSNLQERNSFQDLNVRKSPQMNGEKETLTTNTPSAHIENINEDRKITKLVCQLQPQIENISKEDEDFLKKLSPSIKKTENVLCYFKKVDKKCSSFQNGTNSVANSETDRLIKVKLVSKSRHKSKRKKKIVLVNDNTDNKPHSVSQTTNSSNLTNNVFENTTIISEPKEMESKNELRIENEIEVSRKRKRKELMENNCNLSSNKDNCLPDTMTAKGRPKRCVKKPVKYTDKYEISSSEDEELYIFTPKKENHNFKNSPKNLAEVTEISKEKNSKNNHKRTMKKIHKNNDKTFSNTKLAPIFKKTQKDPVAIEAKQKFLQSGMPDQIKKIISKQNAIHVGIDDFPITRHVKQSKFEVRCQFEKKLEFSPSTIDCVPIDVELSFAKLLDLNTTSNICFSTLFSNNIKKSLKDIKEKYSRFPVYRTYHKLKNKCFPCNQDDSDNNLDHSYEILNNLTCDKIENLNTLNWCEKYRPNTTKDIIGNFEPIKELKKWLTNWKENHMTARTITNNDSDTSDFYNSDTDSRDSLRTNNNLIIITGPVGSGKTSCVYAIASELAMKVIEVNASSRRTGKIILQDLQEATQSHKVDRTKGTTSDNSQNSQEIFSVGSKKRKIISQRCTQKKKLMQCESAENLSQNSNHTEMSIILIDDADIVFDQDDGFASALSQIVQCSKRPVIIVTTSLSSPHLQKYLLYGNVLKMNRLMPRMLGTWLDILCLADSGQFSPGLGAKFLDYFRGDMRKSMNALQFLISSQSLLENCANVTDGNVEDHVEDESSNFSWANADDNNIQSQNLNGLDSLSCLFNSAISSVDTIQKSHSITNLSAWWNLLLPPDASCNHVPISDQNGVHENPFAELSIITSAIDSISLSDMLTNKMKPNTKDDITSYPWFTSECDSVSEKDNVESYNRCCELGHEICSELVQNSLDQAQNIIVRRMSPSAVSEMLLEGEKEKTVHRHHTLTNSFNASAALDRRALATDYWATCRTICRLEKDKIDSNIKRKNRYCHYLKTLKVTSNNDSFYRLCESLCPECKTKNNLKTC